MKMGVSILFKKRKVELLKYFPDSLIFIFSKETIKAGQTAFFLAKKNPGS